MSKFLKRSAAVLSLLSVSMFALAEVIVESPYVRAVPPGQTNTAAFMQLKNDSAEAISLVSASSSIAENVELHNHISEDGVMKMRQVELISISASGNASLEPGGYHVMLIGLNKEIAAGDMVDLEVKFSDGSSQQLTVPVKKVMAHSHHHHH